MVLASKKSGACVAGYWAMIGVVVAIELSVAGSVVAAEPANKTVFGPNVYVFDPSQPAESIQQTTAEIFAKMEANEFGRERYALLFKPGKYKVNFKVGFYTHVAGLGHLPDDVELNGGVSVPADWMPNANATCNFWRTLENFAVIPSETENITRIAVSQAAPLRRLHVKGELQLFAFDKNWNAGWASGGFLADSLIDGKVVPASQQQWISRNCRWSNWTNGVWNMVFVGCEPEPLGKFPEPPYTSVAETPVIREKPFVVVDAKGEYGVFVPALARRTRGPSWTTGKPAGKTIPLDRFHVAMPDKDTAATLNAALTAGKHLLFTPGIYSLDAALQVTKADTVVLGLGVPSLIPTRGNAVITVADVPGVTIAGLILDAGEKKSDALLEVGPTGSAKNHAANPTFLFDLTVRTGGPGPGQNDTGIRINSQHVVGDQLWLWRADHGAGASWKENPTKHGLVVNGQHVTIYGLFNEHHEEYQTVWNANSGRVYLYQSEMPYDVPDQAAWKNGKRQGFASYKVADQVTTHEAWGVGVYAFFRDAAVKADTAIEAPRVPGVKLHSLTTIWLTGKPGSEITHVINDLGGRVYANSPPEAMRQTVTEFPGDDAPKRNK